MPANVRTNNAPRISIPSTGILAARNLGRHRLRTAVNVAGIVLSSAALVFFLAFYRGTYEGVMFASVIDHATSHGQIQAQGFDEEDPDSWLGEAMLFPEDILTRNGEFPGPEGPEVLTSPRLTAPGLAGDGSRKARVIIAGVDAAREGQVLGIYRRLTAGSPDPSAVLVGRKLAESLGLEIGDEIRIQASMVDGAPNLDYWKVGGIFSTGYPPVDRGMVFMPLDQAQNFLGAGKRVNKVLCRVNPGQGAAGREAGIALLEAGTVQKSLAGVGLTFRNWKDFARPIVDDAAKDGGFFAIFIGILLALSLSTMAGTMRMTVQERKREIGMLRASGWYRSEIGRLFLLEAALVGLAGGVLGCLAGSAGALWLAANPVTMNLDSMDIPRFSLSAELLPQDVFWALASGILAALAAGILPARTGARMPVLAALDGR